MKPQTKANEPIEQEYPKTRYFNGSKQVDKIQDCTYAVTTYPLMTKEQADALITALNQEGGEG